MDTYYYIKCKCYGYCHYCDIYCYIIALQVKKKLLQYWLFRFK